MKKKNKPEGYQFSNWHSYLPQLPRKKEPIYKKKKKKEKGKEILWRAWVHIFSWTTYSPKPHTTWGLGSGG